MTNIMAPVLPYLAEEIHDAHRGDGQSVFKARWTSLVNSPVHFVHSFLEWVTEQ